MEATMKVTRITMAECISEEALEKAVEDHRNSAAQVWPTAEFHFDGKNWTNFYA